MKRYNLSADVVRVLAIVGVVVIHTANSVFARPDFVGGMSWWFSLLLNSISRPAIPLFIMVSGYFILAKDESYANVIRRTWNRLGIPFLFWFLVDMVWNGPAKMIGYRQLLPFFGFTILGVGISGLQIFPGIELIKNAARSPHESTTLFTKILIQPWQMLALPFPNIFGNPATRTYWPSDTFVGKVTTVGLVPLFFLPAAFRKNTVLTRFYFILGVIILICITANPLTALFSRINVPLVSTSSPTLSSFLFSFSLAVLAGFGLDYWMEEKHSVKKLVIRTFEVGILFCLLFGATKLSFLPFLSLHVSVVFRALLYGGAIAGCTIVLFWVAIAFPKWRNWAITVLLVVQIADLFVFFIRFNPFVSPTLVFPNHPIISFLTQHAPDRSWGYGTASIDANFATQYRFLSPEGYDPLYPKWYGEFLYSYKTGHIETAFTDATRSDASLTAGFGANGFSDPRLKRMLDVLSVRYVLDRTENGSTAVTFPPNEFQPASTYADWHIFENEKAVPRAFFAQDIWAYKNTDDFSQKFYSSRFDPKTAVLLPSFPMGVAPSMPGGTAIITSDTSESITIETNRSSPGVLVVTDTYYPGWVATVDGKPSSVLRADWALRAVVIPAGTHSVTMTYQPESVAVGAIVSMISIILTAMGVVFAYKRHA